MGPKIGVWIDHRQAILVTTSEAGEETAGVHSSVEKQLRRTGDSPLKGSYEAASVPPDDHRQNAFSEHLNTYYDAVIERLRHASAILIFGPGEAKHELQNRLNCERLGERVVAVETEDQMTQPRIEAKVRAYFASHHANVSV